MCGGPAAAASGAAPGRGAGVPVRPPGAQPDCGCQHLARLPVSPGCCWPPPGRRGGGRALATCWAKRSEALLLTRKLLETASEPPLSQVRCCRRSGIDLQASRRRRCRPSAGRRQPAGGGCWPRQLGFLGLPCCLCCGCLIAALVQPCFARSWLLAVGGHNPLDPQLDAAEPGRVACAFGVGCLLALGFAPCLTRVPCWPSCVLRAGDRLKLIRACSASCGAGAPSCSRSRSQVGGCC